MGCSNSVSVAMKSSKGTLLAVQADRPLKAAQEHEPTDDEEVVTETPPATPERIERQGMTVESTESVDDGKACEASSIVELSVSSRDLGPNVVEPAQEPEPAEACAADTDARLEAAALKIQSLQRAMAAREVIKTLNAEAKASEANAAEADMTAPTAAELGSTNDADSAPRGPRALLHSATTPGCFACFAAPEAAPAAKRGLIFNMEGVGVYNYFSHRAATSSF